MFQPASDFASDATLMDEPASDMLALAQPPARIAVARGDGIGPEISEAVLRVLAAAGSALDLCDVTLGEAAYRAGSDNGIETDAWSKLQGTDALLKAPLTTPPGSGWKSVNVTLRKALGLYANVRPVRSYEPFVIGARENMDLVIIRENEEDVYAGIEHRQTDDVVQCLKLMSRRGCQRVIRYAFAYARAHGRRKVTCLAKHNIMKLTDGLFVKVFEEEAALHPDIEPEVMIVDIGAARIAARPDAFDVVVTGNLYGDIVSDIAAEIAGSVGLAGSANIGRDAAMFEAVHGSAPDIAGQGIANPSGLLMAATQMLDHLGQGDSAALIRNAWARTIEDGVHTADLAGAHTRRAPVGTLAFADAVIANLGEMPRTLASARPAEGTGQIEIEDPDLAPAAQKVLRGIDVFIANRDSVPTTLAAGLNLPDGAPFVLELITNRGVAVWPKCQPATRFADHWRCRFMARAGVDVTSKDVIALLAGLDRLGHDIIKTENLYSFDGAAGFSKAHGA